MNIISTTYVDGTWEQIVVCGIGVLLSLLLALLAKDSKGFYRYSYLAMSAALSFIIVFVLINIGDFADSYDLLKVEVYDWNEVMNNDKYRIISTDGNIVELRVLD